MGDGAGMASSALGAARISVKDGRIPPMRCRRALKYCVSARWADSVSVTLKAQEPNENCTPR